MHANLAPRTLAVTLCWALLVLAQTSPAQDAEQTGIRQVLAARIQTVNTDSAAKAAAIDKGRELASFCARCHGADGNSDKALIPHLSGEDPDYLLDQIEKFADGRRDDFIMTPLAKRFTDEEKVALVVYYTSMPRKPIDEISNTPALVGKGRKVYERACQHCHGTEGRSDKGRPNIAGQPSEYVARTLEIYGELRTGRLDQEKLAATKELSGADIEAVSAYIADLR